MSVFVNIVESVFDAAMDLIEGAVDLVFDAVEFVVDEIVEPGRRLKRDLVRLPSL